MAVQGFVCGWIFGARWGSVEGYGGRGGGRDDVPGSGFMVWIGGCVDWLSWCSGSRGGREFDVGVMDYGKLSRRHVRDEGVCWMKRAQLGTGGWIVKLMSIGA